MVKPKRLYDFPFSGNGYKCRLAMTQLGIPYEYEVVDIVAGETRTPAFLAMNPLGQIPVLELDDGTYLRDSSAILTWLTEGTWLMPAGRLERARAAQWMSFDQNYIDKVIGRARFLRCYPQYRAVAPEEFEQWWAEGYFALGVLEAELAGHAFMIGETYSVADIVIYGYVHCAAEGGFALDRYPAVRAWLERVREQPGHVTIDDYPRG